MGNRLDLGDWSTLCFILSVMVWWPNLTFDDGFLYWMAGHAIAAIGTILAVIDKSWGLVALNLIMANSVFIFIAIGYHHG